MKPRTRKVVGQPAWIVKNDVVEAAITRHGGMMAPVSFCLSPDKSVQPYYLSPWQDSKETPSDPAHVALRGDFFCIPFGAPSDSDGQEYRQHGDAVAGNWSQAERSSSCGVTMFSAGFQTKNPVGRITKRLYLRERETTIYSVHELQGYSVAAPLGHHAILRGTSDAPLHITTSPIDFGMVSPEPNQPCINESYSALESGARFENIDAVPTRWKNEPVTDCSYFPSRHGFTDLLAIFQKRSEGAAPAWVTAARPDRGYLWFSLKNRSVLPSTVFWMDNHGRYSHPWNGRNQCIGLEDVCSCFAFGLKTSVGENLLTRQGIPTALTLNPTETTYVRYIQGVVGIPPDFTGVRHVDFSPLGVRFYPSRGAPITAPVCWQFLFGREL